MKRIEVKYDTMTTEQKNLWHELQWIGEKLLSTAEYIKDQDGYDTVDITAVDDIHYKLNDLRDLVFEAYQISDKLRAPHLQELADNYGDE